MEMTANEALTLFSRDHCHLCEVAVQMLERAGIAYTLVDVDADPELQAKYGIHVPVLLHPVSGRELCFPFTEEQLTRFRG